MSYKRKYWDDDDDDEYNSDEEDDEEEDEDDDDDGEDGYYYDHSNAKRLRRDPSQDHCSGPCSCPDQPSEPEETDENPEEPNEEDLDEAEAAINNGYDDPDEVDEYRFNQNGFDEHGHHANDYDEDYEENYDEDYDDPEPCARCGVTEHDTNHCPLYRTTTYTPCMVCRQGLHHFSKVCQS